MSRKRKTDRTDPGHDVGTCAPCQHEQHDLCLPPCACGCDDRRRAIEKGARVAGFDPAAGPDRSAVVVLERAGHEPETYRVAGAPDWKGAPLLMVRAAANNGLLLELAQLRPGAVILTEPPVPPERAWSVPVLPEGVAPPGAGLDGYELRIRLIDGEERHVETCWHFTCGCWLTVLELTGAVIRREPCGGHGR